MEATIRSAPPAASDPQTMAMPSRGPRSGGGACRTACSKTEPGVWKPCRSASGAALSRSSVVPQAVAKSETASKAATAAAFFGNSASARIAGACSPQRPIR